MDVEEAVEELLVDEEVIKILRLDQAGLKSPREALRNLRRQRRIGYVRQGRRILYPRSEVEAYIARNHVQALAS